MKRLLVICPSLNRSEKITAFLDSFTKTKSPGTDLILGLDQNDPEFNKYHDLSNTYDFAIGLFAGENITKILNAIALDGNNNYDYYMPCNDDFVFQTPGWDRLLIEEIENSKFKKGIAYGNDLFQGENCPSTSVISGEIVRGLGWLQMPSLTHLYGDRIWQTLGRQTGSLYYRSDIIIEHQHFLTNKSQSDKISEKTNSDQMYTKDGEEYTKWLVNHAADDCLRLRAILCQN